MKKITICRFLAMGALLALVAGKARSQTQIDLRTQAKDVDFSAAPFTKSFQSGTTLPGACTVGGTFFKTNALAGSNFYACTSTNVWSAQGAPTGARFLLDTADAGLANGQVGVAGPGIIISHSPFTISFNSNVLAGVYASLAGPNTFAAGSRNTFQASATTEGIRIVGGSIPSAPLAGALFLTLAGRQGYYDGSSVQIHSTVAGIGVVPPVAPSLGSCTVWGSGFTQTDGGGPCAIRVSAPASSGAACTTGQYATTSTFAYFCVANNTWVRAALSTF
jgi:hypothetical protein